MKGGLSGCRGIMMYETAKKGINCVYGYYANGSIIVRKGEHEKLKEFRLKHEEAHKCNANKEDRILLTLLLIMLAFCAVAFFTCPLRYFFGALLLSAAAYMPILALWFANTNTYESEEIQQQFRRFHGCEHALFACYVHGKNEKKRVADIEELRKASYYDPECGTVYCGYALFLLAVITVMVLNFSSLGLLKFIGILVLTVVLLFANIFNPLNPFKILQKPAVAQPTDYEYLLGLRLIEKFWEVLDEEPETPEAEKNEAENADQ